MYLLTSDIGGTRARFRLLEKTGLDWEVRHQESYPSADFDSLAEAADHYLDHQLSTNRRKEIRAGWFAVAGPVTGDSVTFTNRRWRTNAADLAEKLGLPVVHLANDLEALAHAIPFLPENELVPVQRCPPGNDRYLVIAAGTGLGMATLWANDQTVKAFSSEGGHCDLAPVTDIHCDLLRYLHTKFEHVSYERVLSGPGLVMLYQFVQQREHRAPLTGGEKPPPTPESISQLASDNDPVAAMTIELFVQLLGSFAGNGALQWLARGGVYLAGGVTAGLAPFITDDTFTSAFHDKGRMSPLMEQIPVTIVASDTAGLEGITRMAIQHQR